LASGPQSSLQPPPAWDTDTLRDPHGIADKRRRVRQMFTAIAPSYDLNNRLHSLWLDQHWRKTAVKLAQLAPNDVVIDVACGTGDLTLLMARQLSRLSGNDRRSTGQVIGIDFTFAMLPLAVRKAAGAPISFLAGDAQSLPLADESADVVSIAFGIRNVVDVSAALSEFYRILRPRGRLIVLEFALPANRVLRWMYNLYFRHVLPRTATLVSGDRTGAYRYLPQSVNTFIGPEQMMQMLRQAGFARADARKMTAGICIGYRAVK
jgi:demethylmenaquinone methyltransferase / 2-methoxy-6-polyprenyl-1,4-benzoquinol methylase